MLTIDDVIAKLDQCEYPGPYKIITKEYRQELKDSRLVVIYGSSDDLMEIDGAFYDEVGAGHTIRFDCNGKLDTGQESKCECDDCPYYEQARNAMPWFVRATGDLPWRYETNIPHKVFTVMEDGEEYGQGIVFEIPTEVPGLTFNHG